MKITRTKYTLPKTTLKTACNDVLILFFDVYVRQNYLLKFRQKLQPFSDIYFRIDNMMGMVTENFLTTYFRKT